MQSVAEQLLCKEGTQSLYFLKNSTFVYVFARAIFQKRLFYTANLFFTVTLFIYHLVIGVLIPGILYSHYSRVHRVGAPPR